MNEKLRLLSVTQKKIKKREKRKSLVEMVEVLNPETYQSFSYHLKEDIIKKILEIDPHVVFLCKQKPNDALKLISSIKKIKPSVVIFAFLPDILDNEQDTIEEYMAAGVYKCLYSVISLDTLIHDIHVSLNLE